MYKFWYILLALPLLLVSCNGQDAEQTAATEQAITDYRDFVTGFEQDSLSVTKLRAMQQAENDSVSWEEEKENLQNEYEEQRSRLEASRQSFSAEQRAEADQLDQRYNNALEKRGQQYQDASHRYKLRKELLGLEIQSDDLSEITAGNIAETYTRFTSKVQENTDKYENRDWLLVDGWWSALNSRYRTLEANLSASVKRTIQQAQSQYKEIRPVEDLAQADSQAVQM
ncbi:hypothetical protein [uncultured Pontibacter sp.]|uniref:hypothetical protein n=1 Tax=uncultured Pontibacter sp. TaxID=453356 RepID=UPI002637A515|nr:hypothetical protein [uncultured Pontibacter sp.]